MIRKKLRHNPVSHCNCHRIAGGAGVVPCDMMSQFQMFTRPARPPGCCELKSGRSDHFCLDALFPRGYFPAPSILDGFCVSGPQRPKGGIMRKWGMALAATGLLAG